MWFNGTQIDNHRNDLWLFVRRGADGILRGEQEEDESGG